MLSVRPHPLHAHGNCLQGARANIKEERAHVLDEAAPLTCSRECSIRGHGVTLKRNVAHVPDEAAPLTCSREFSIGGTG
jgi:hypothetical protein